MPIPLRIRLPDPGSGLRGLPAGVWIIFAASLVLTGLVLLVIPLSHGFALVGALTFVWGFVADAPRPATMSALTNATPAEQRKAAIAFTVASAPAWAGIQRLCIARPGHTLSTPHTVRGEHVIPERSSPGVAVTTVRRRTFGRTGWSVGELGVGMWGMGGWTGSNDAESLESLQLAVDLGCNFFDTALAYGEGKSERLLGELVRQNAGAKLYVATKVPPKNREWPSRREFTLDDVFPPDYIRRSTEQSLEHLGAAGIDLLQFHVWEDSWADDDRWQRVIDDLKRERLIRAVGISINRWEPWNGLRTVRTGMVDAVQVIYNVFDQAPEDELFPLCRELDVAVIARVPFDEGSLTGTLTKDTRWPDGDWRNVYFGPENLEPTVGRVARLEPLVPAGSSLPDLALRFILSNADVSVVIPGMRRAGHVRANAAASVQGALSPSLLAMLREHRWDREPTEWSH